jgi:hypothetical protein
VTKTLNGASAPTPTPPVHHRQLHASIDHQRLLKGVLVGQQAVVTYFADTNGDTRLATPATRRSTADAQPGGAGTYTFDVLVTPPVHAQLQLQRAALGPEPVRHVGDTSNGWS